MIKIKKPFTLITDGFDVPLEETVKYDFVVSKETWTVLKEFETASVVIGYPEGYDDSDLNYLPKWTLEDILDQFYMVEDDKEEFDEHEENYEWFGEIFEWVD